MTSNAYVYCFGGWDNPSSVYYTQISPSSSSLSQLTITTQDTSGQSISNYPIYLNQSYRIAATHPSPAAFTVNDGQTYTVWMAGHSESCSFDHWADTGSTNAQRSITITSDTHLTAIVSCVPRQSNVVIPQGTGSTFAFSPFSMTVVVGINNTIVWTDRDSSSPHNVAFISVPPGAPVPPVSPTLSQGSSYNVTLTVPGTYIYECQFHPAWMLASIVVKGGNGSSYGASTIAMPQGAGSGSNFSPGGLSVVVVGVNNTITFSDQDTVAPHNVIWISVPTGANPPNSQPIMNKGDTFSVTLTVPGTYIFECQYHPTWMKGTITVLSPTTSSTTSSSSSSGGNSTAANSGPSITTIINDEQAVAGGLSIVYTILQILFLIF